MGNNRKSLGNTGIGPPYEYEEMIEDLSNRHLREKRSKEIEERTEETAIGKYKPIFFDVREMREVAEKGAKRAMDDFTESEEFKKKVNEIAKTNTEKIIRETKDELRDKIDDSKLKTIETLGIFVALFTFVSIEFQVFRTLDNAQSVAGLTLILLGSLLTFITVLDSVLSKIKLQEDIEFKLLKPKSWPLVFIWMLLMILGGALFVSSPK
ncbi:MAG: hypothetical protein KAS78_01885 [Candidatus Pacebacteria bacterium]|nr:hypothetical protein [Candidatus Paceibacterota bacterium]